MVLNFNQGNNSVPHVGGKLIALAVPKKKASGCAIAVAVVAVVAVVFVGLIALTFMLPSMLRKRYSEDHPPPGGPGTKWQYNESVSEMDGTKTVFWYADANNPVEGWLTNKVPILFVQFGPTKKVDVYVETGMQSSVEQGKDHTVRLKYDEGSPGKQYWHDSMDGKALFARDGLGVAKKLIDSKKLMFEFTPFNARDQQVATFDVNGLKEAIGHNPLCSTLIR